VGQLVPNFLVLDPQNVKTRRIESLGASSSIFQFPLLISTVYTMSDIEDNVDAIDEPSPTGSPPEAKRRKLAERDANGFLAFDRNSDVVKQFESFYRVRQPLLPSFHSLPRLLRSKELRNCPYKNC